MASTSVGSVALRKNAAASNANVEADSVFGRHFDDLDFKTLKRILNIYYKKKKEDETARNLFDRVKVLESQLEVRDRNTIRQVLGRGEVLTRKALDDGPIADDSEDEKEKNGQSQESSSTVKSAVREVQKLCPICATNVPESDIPESGGHTGCPGMIYACKNCILRHIQSRMATSPWTHISCLACNRLLPPDSVKKFLSGDVLEK